MKQFATILLYILLSIIGFADASPVIVKQAPQLSGRLDGDIQVLSESSFNLNNNSKINGNILVVGSPTIQQNGNPTFLGEITGSGQSGSVDYTIQLNNGAKVGNIVTRTNAVTLPIVALPVAPTGQSHVNLNPGDSVEDWSVVKSLNINSDVGDVVIPAGSYQNIQVGSGSNIVLGTANGPSVYHFSQLQLSGNAKLVLAGPVTINLKSGLNVNNQTKIGRKADGSEESLEIKIYSGSVNINQGAEVFASIVAPESNVNISGTLTGGLVSKSLNLNNGAKLISVTGRAPNVEEEEVEEIEEGTSTVTPQIDSEACKAVVVKERFQLDGTINGSVHLQGATDLNLNATAEISGDLLVPGNPNINVNGNPNFGVEQGDGVVNVNPYSININSGVTLGKVITHSDPISLVKIAAPQAPQGQNQITLNKDQSFSDWANLRSLILNSSYGNINVPAGVYDEFTLNADTSITLGVTNSTVPTVYDFTSLSLNSDSELILAGPVILNVKSGLTLNNNSILGQSLGGESHSLVINVFSGNVDVNNQSRMNAQLVAHNSNVHINGTFTGSLTAKNLTVNSNAVVTIYCDDTSENRAPVAAAINITTSENIAAIVALTATDLNSDELTYSIVTPPTNGVLSGEAPNYTYTPNTDYSGVDSFTYKANDGSLDSNIATVTITVTPTVVNAPVANNVDITTPEDTAVVTVLSATDLDGGALTYNILTQPSNGVLSGEAPNLTYTPNSNYNGADSFTYQVNDGTLDSNIGTVTITVTSINDTPIAQNLTITTNEITPIAIILQGSDSDLDALTYSILNQPSNGSIVGEGENISYQPSFSFIGQDSFTYQVTDPEGLVSNIATVTITVVDVNNPPIAVAQTFTIFEDQIASIILHGLDPDGEGVTYELVTETSNGTLTGVAPSLSYAPTSNFNGVDTFTFKTNDGTQDSDIATITINVIPQNDAPVAADVVLSIDPNVSISVTLQGSDIDGDQLTYEILSQPSNGTISIPADFSGESPVISYIPENGYLGNEQFSYKVTDSSGLSDEASVTIEIGEIPINQPPVVDLGEDRVVEISLDKGRNLIFEEGESVLDVQNWDDEGNWINYDLDGEENIIEGNIAFKVSNANDGLIYREIDLNSYEDSINQGAQLLEFSVFSKSSVGAEKADQASLSVIFYDITGAQISENIIAIPEQSDEWALLAIKEFIPEGAVSAIIELKAVYGFFDNSNDVLFTAPKLFIYNAASVPIIGAVTDDGLPDDSLTYQWNQTTGDSLFYIENENEAILYPKVIGEYGIELTVSDGEYEVKDDLLINITNSLNSIPIVNAGDDKTFHFSSGGVALEGEVIDVDSSPDQLIISWAFIDGPIIPVITDPTSAQTEIFFKEFKF